MLQKILFLYDQENDFVTHKIKKKKKRNKQFIKFVNSFPRIISSNIPKQKFSALTAP